MKDFIFYLFKIFTNYAYKGYIYIQQHSHSRTAVRNSRREVDMNVHVVLYLRACTYRYRCLISKICVLLTQIFLDMCIAVCLPGQLVNRY